LRRQLALDRRRRIDPAGLAEGAVGQPDIDADDLPAVQQDAVEIFQAEVAGIEVGRLLAQRRRRADQRFQRIEIVLDVLQRIGAEALDELPGILASDVVVRIVGDGDDGEEDGNGEKEERRQDTGF
jgi:hypothetical protein